MRFGFDPTTKPPAGSEVDWGHPLARGLRRRWLLNEGSGSRVNDVCRSTAGALVNTPGWSRGGLQFTTALSQYVLGGNQGDVQQLFSTEDWTIFGKIIWRSANGGLICKYPPAYLMTYDYKSLACIIYNGAVSIIGLQQSATDLPLENDPTEFAWTVQRQGVSTFYIRGQVSGTPADISSHAAEIWPTAANLVLGARDETAGYNTVDMQHAGIYNRALTPHEVAWLHAEPYSMIQAPGARFWSFASRLTRGPAFVGDIAGMTGGFDNA